MGQVGLPTLGLWNPLNIRIVNMFTVSRKFFLCVVIAAVRIAAAIHDPLFLGPWFRSWDSVLASAKIASIADSAFGRIATKELNLN